MENAKEAVPGTVYVISDYFLATYSDHCNDQAYLSKLPTEHCPTDLLNLGTVRKFQVFGNNMEPVLHHKDYIYGSLVSYDGLRDLDRKLRPGSLYAIVSKGHPILLKRLEYQQGDDFVTGHSDNADKVKYPSVKIKIADIKELWQWQRTYTSYLPAMPKVREAELVA